MMKLTLKQFNSIHKDYRGKIDGKRTGFNASIRSKAGLHGWGDMVGTALLIEGVHFEIVKN